MMIPFQIDPSWYERHWWREQSLRRRRPIPSRLISAAARVGHFLWPLLRFLGVVLALIVSGDFRLPTRDDTLEPADQGIDSRSSMRSNRVPMPQIWE
jgi:hypothetical protein